MKTLKNTFILIALLSGLSIAAKAQDTTRRVKTESYGSGILLSAGVEAGLPVGHLHDNYNWSFGGSLEGDFPILKNQLYATLNAGYTNIHHNNDSRLKDIQEIPVMAGMKYFPISRFYIQGQAGASFLTDHSDLNADKSTTFVYAPQIGTLINLGKSSYLDAGVKFEGNTKFYDNGKSNNFIGLRVAYAFSL
ncbi:outer membrane beta-barrel protein [Mucilaginibacter sp.]|uniref:outer membrane beta-barrel protein n=1 Tax=Mucilaginibacter sp. TaxID=1882438 RepID=UPI00356B0D0E